MFEEVRNALRSFIIEYAEIDVDDPDFTDDVHLFDYGFVDSLGATEIILYVEEKFHVEITQEDITLYAMNTVNEIAEVVANKLENK